MQDLSSYGDYCTGPPPPDQTIGPPPPLKSDDLFLGNQEILNPFQKSWTRPCASDLSLCNQAV